MRTTSGTLRTTVLRAALLGVAAVLLPAATAAADEPDPAAAATWALGPATQDGADGRISLRRTIDPGGSADDLVVLTNFSSRATTFTLYAGDGLVDDGGTFDIGPAGEVPTDAGSWITLGPVDGAQPDPDGRLVLEVAAESSVLIPVRIAVPADAAPGDHPAGVVAELAAPDGAVQLASRVGVRVHLRVAGDVTAALRVTDVHARWVPSWNPFAAGTVHLTYDIENAGNVRLGSEARTTLAGPFGLGTATSTASHREILPGRAVTVEADLPSWPVVRSTGQIEVRPGLVGDDALAIVLMTETAGLTVWTVPWTQLALVAAVVALLLVVRRTRRRAAARVQARIDAAVAQARTEPETEPAADR
jgi:hypothetical protein